MSLEAMVEHHFAEGLCSGALGAGVGTQMCAGANLVWRGIEICGKPGGGKGRLRMILSSMSVKEKKNAYTAVFHSRLCMDYRGGGLHRTMQANDL